MKLKKIFIINLMIGLILLLSCRSNKNYDASIDSSANDFVIFDTLQGSATIFLYPVGEANDIYFTNTTFFDFLKNKDTTIHFGLLNTKKTMFYDRIKFKIIQEILDSNLVKISLGNYIVDRNVYIAKERLYNNQGEETDTIIATKYYKGFRDGNWLYWNESGILIKEEIWEKGTLKDTKD